MVFTTNKPRDLWGHLLHDPDLADAILARGHIVTPGIPSMRTRYLDPVPVTLTSATPQHSARIMQAECRPRAIFMMSSCPVPRTIARLGSFRIRGLPYEMSWQPYCGLHFGCA